MDSVGQGLLSSVGKIAGRPAKQYRWSALHDAARDAVAHRRLGEASERLVEAAALAREEWPGSPQLGESLALLADVRAALGRDSDALKLYQRAIEVLGMMHDGIGPALAHAVSNMGRVMVLGGRRARGDALIAAGSAMQRKLGFPNSPTLLLNRAIAAAEARRDAEAQLAFNDAVAALESTRGASELLGICVHDNYARFCVSRDRHEDARVLLRFCMILRQEAAGPRHPLYAAGLVNFACLQFDAPTREEAEALLWQAADICERAGPRPSSGLLTALYHLARLTLHDGRRGECEKLCDRMLELGETDPGLAAPAEAATLQILSCLGGDTSSPEETDSALRLALHLAEGLDGAWARLGRDIVVEILPHLAVILAQRGRAVEADRLVARGTELQRTPLWDFSRHVLPST